MLVEAGGKSEYSGVLKIRKLTYRKIETRKTHNPAKVLPTGTYLERETLINRAKFSSALDFVSDTPTLRPQSLGTKICL
jgi:hypothetical protein